MRTSRLLAVAGITALLGLVPWLTGEPLLLRLFGALVSLAGLGIGTVAALTTVALREAQAQAQARSAAREAQAGGCQGCGGCQCGSATGGDPATAAATS